mmetsp:Transcript_81638/g.205428  ORF Transcript_81638/g.205428 Transcript_81638/m.205428 type:complete len:345 (+) Transcript_81638:1262-2296(+)
MPISFVQATDTGCCQAVGVRLPSFPTSWAVKVKLYFVPFTAPCVAHVKLYSLPSAKSWASYGNIQKALILGGITSISNSLVPTILPLLYIGTIAGIGVTDVFKLLAMTSKSWLTPAWSHWTGGTIPLDTTSSLMTSSKTAAVGSFSAALVLVPGAGGRKAVFDFHESKKQGPSSMMTRLSKNVLECIFEASGTLNVRPFRFNLNKELAKVFGSAIFFTSAWSDIVTDGKRKLMLLILAVKALMELSCQITLSCTSTSFPSTCIFAVTGAGWHSPFTMDEQVAVPFPTSSFPSSRIETSIGMPTSWSLSTNPKVKSSTLSVYSATPVLIWLLVILYWPLAPTLIT